VADGRKHQKQKLKTKLKQVDRRGLPADERTAPGHLRGLFHAHVWRVSTCYSKAQAVCSPPPFLPPHTPHTPLAALLTLPPPPPPPPPSVQQRFLSLIRLYARSTLSLPSSSSLLEGLSRTLTGQRGWAGRSNLPRVSNGGLPSIESNTHTHTYTHTHTHTHTCMHACM